MLPPTDPAQTPPDPTTQASCPPRRRPRRCNRSPPLPRRHRRAADAGPGSDARCSRSSSSRRSPSASASDASPRSASATPERAPRAARPHRSSTSSARHGTRSTRSTSAGRTSTTATLAYGAIDGLTEAVGDTGHTSFLTPEERAARERRAVRVVRRDRHPDRRDRRRPAARRRRLPEQPGGGGRHPGRGHHRERRRPVDNRPHLDDVAGWIRGEAGTSVELTVRAGTDGPPRTYTIKRADVPIESVSWTLVPGSRTALLRLDSFSHGSADDMVKALKAIKEAGADRLVLDLRGNPGGFVNEATGIASQFIALGRRLRRARRRRQGDAPSGLARRGRAGPAARGAGRQGHRQCRRDPLGRAAGCRPCPGRGRHDVRDRDGPRRVRAVRQVSACGSGPSSG